MRFKLTMSAWKVPTEEKIKLENYGFIFIPYEEPDYPSYKEHPEWRVEAQKENEGLWVLTTESENAGGRITLDSLEDLLAFQKEIGYSVIVRKALRTNETILEIYNGYRE